MPAFPLPLSGDLGARPTRVGGVRGSGAVVLRRGGAPPMETGAPHGGPRAGIGDCRRDCGSFSFRALLWPATCEYGPLTGPWSLPLLLFPSTERYNFRPLFV